MRLIAFIYLVHFIRHAMVLPIIPLFAQSMGCSGLMIGVAVSAFSLLSLFIALPIGMLSDRLNAKKLILVSTAFNFIHSVLLAMAGNVWILISAQMFGGLGYMLLMVSSQTWVSKHTEKKVREKGFGLLALGAAIGQSIGPFLGGFVLSNTSFAAVFTLAAFVSLPGFFIACLREEPKGEQEHTGQSVKTIRETLSELAADRKILAALIFTFVAVFAAELRSSFVPVLFKAQGRQVMAIGLLLSVFALSMTLVRLVIGRVMGMISRGVLLSLALALFLVASTTLPSVPDVWISGVIMLLFGMGFGISQPLSMVMVSDRAGKTSGLVMGIRFFVVTMGTLLSPILTGAVVEWFSLESAFYFAGGLIMAGGILICILSCRKHQKLA